MRSRRGGPGLRGTTTSQRRRAGSLARPPSFRGSFRVDPTSLAAHSTAAGPFSIRPSAVAVPADAEDVQTLVAWAARQGTPIVPRGAATGLPAGNVGPWLAVDLVPGLGEIEPVDPDAGTLRCGAGAVAAAVARTASDVGLAFPPLPSSAERCTIGGMVANNAAGARSFKHGATREWLTSLDIVWPDGSRSRVETGQNSAPTWSRELASDLGAGLGGTIQDHGWPQVRKNSSGYALDRFLPDGDALQLMVGSEGTLGIVVGATVRLSPQPLERGVLLVGLPFLDSIPSACSAAQEANASACELFGRRLLELADLAADPLLRDVAQGAAAVVLLEVEGSSDQVESGLALLKRWADEEGVGSVAARDEEGRTRLWEIRHGASPLIARCAEHGLRSTQFIEDSVVPVTAVPDYLRGVNDILEHAETEAVVFGHAGDGNIHVNPLVDVREPDRVRTILEETVALVARLGGTLSGEHGDGRVRAPFLDRIWSPGLVSAFRKIKGRLDPDGLMNPGVILPLPGQDPLEGLWVNSTAALHPSSARGKL